MSRLSTLHTQLTRGHTAYTYTHIHTCIHTLMKIRGSIMKFMEVSPICIACAHEFRVCLAQGNPLVYPASVMSVCGCVCVCAHWNSYCSLCVRVCALFMFMRVFTLLITLNEPHAICFHLWRRLFQTFGESPLGD